MNDLMSTKEVAKFLGVSEKMVYTLVSDKGLPATKITSKWTFPKHLVDQWIEINTINYPKPVDKLPSSQNLLVITGSNDPLLEKTISLFNHEYPKCLAVFGNVGSRGGLNALKQSSCQIVSSHLLQEDGEEYNFDFIRQELDCPPAVVSFCKREQGLLIQKGNPKQIKGIVDLGKAGVRIANRPLETGTRLLLDKELEKAGLKKDSINGYDNEFSSHLEVGIEVLCNRVDAAPGIRAIASLLDLDFMPFRWERFDLLIPKERFLDKEVQLFLGLFHEPSFMQMTKSFVGYDFSSSGKVLFPNE